MKSVLVLQHTEAEFLGLIEDHLEGRGIGFQYLRPFSGTILPPDAGEADGLIVLGGGQWGSESQPRLPTLEAEVDLARDFLAKGRPVIGFALGAQILARASGGGAAASELEFGVLRARRTVADALGGHLPEVFPLAVYMRDRPLPPAAATILATDDAGGPAVFQIGKNAFGFTGHPGAKTGMIEDLVMEFGEWHEDVSAQMDAVRRAQSEIEAALISLMAGLMAVTGLMRDGSSKPD